MNVLKNLGITVFLVAMVSVLWFGTINLINNGLNLFNAVALGGYALVALVIRYAAKKKQERIEQQKIEDDALWERYVATWSQPNGPVTLQEFKDQEFAKN